MEAPARIRARERGREWNEIIGGQGSEVEDGGKKRGLSHTFPLFLTSKIPPVRRNYSPPLKRTALLRCCFIPRSPLPPWQLFLIPSEVNGLGNEAFRGSPHAFSTLPSFCCKISSFYFLSHCCDRFFFQFASLRTHNLLVIP